MRRWARAHGVALPLLAVFAGGALVSLQVYVNGRMGRQLGSSELAAVTNHAVGLLAILLVSVLLGVPGRARRQLVAAPRPRWWWLAGGVNGALFIILAAYAAPRVGVALLTVASVCGQTVGSLVLDGRGMSPAGVRPITAGRLLGALLALTAVSLAALGSSVHGDLGLLGLAVALGAGIALQQAAMGHLAILTGEPLAAAGLNLTVGITVLVVAAAIATGFTAPGGWSAPALDWTAGLYGAVAAVAAAWAVPRLGVLQIMLVFVAGQSVGGLVIDLVDPPAGEHVTAATIAGVVLTIVAVFLGGVSRSRGSPRGGPVPAPGMAEAAAAAEPGSVR